MLFSILSISLPASLLLLATTTLGAPSPLRTVERYNGHVKPGSYIVTLKSGVNRTSVIHDINAPHDVTHQWGAALNGFAGKFDDAALTALRAHGEVESIAEDGVMSIDTVVTQTDAPWGLARLSSSSKLPVSSPEDTSSADFSYTYDDTAGSGVDIYVLDTGIYVDHEDFEGVPTNMTLTHLPNRWGATFGDYPDADGYGHGTHVAGTAAGTRYGIAKAANLIAVKVLADNGSAYNSDVISGLNWVLTAAQASGRPSIATMSLGGGASYSVDVAVQAATPHVAGLVAYLISLRGNSNPAAMSTLLQTLSLKSVIGGVPSGTINDFAHIA